MRIGVDATCWANERGYGRFTRELVTSMTAEAPSHHFVCFLDVRSASRFSLRRENVESVIVPQSVPPTLAAATGGRRSVTDMLRLSNAVRRSTLDVFFSPAVYGYFPLPPGLVAAVTVHDAIAERFPTLTLPAWRDRLFWRLKVQLALWQARLVLTVSEYAASQISQYLHVPPSKMRVTLEGVAAAFSPSDSAAQIRSVADRVGLLEGTRWIIYVGGFGPHKHVDLLVRAHAAVVARHPTPPLALLLVGSQSDGFHEHLADIRHTIQECGTDRLVRWTDHVPDEELRHLHSGAVALVLASASEGFGLPAVEAARCGTPVVATTESPLPHVLEGGGLFVAPGDVDALAAAIERLLTDDDLRRRLGQRALQMSQRLSWSQSAAVAIKALEEAASGQVRPSTR